MSAPLRAAVLGVASLAAAAAAASPKLVVTILIDDLGSYDTAVNNPDIAWLTPNLAKLSHAQGLRLSRFYVNKFCSPTRRSFLTGRFPVHVSMMQAQPCDNTLPLETTLLSEKLKQAPLPYATHFVGKGHLGYPTTDHLPINRGFDSHVGYLCGAEDYDYGYNEGRNPGHDCAKSMHGSCIYDFWHDHTTGQAIHDEVFYSTNYYTTTAVSIIKNHTTVAPSQPLWVHLMYQGVHSPYVAPPAWEQLPNDTQTASFWQPEPFGSMLRAVDTGIGNLTAAIHAVDGLWEHTLLIITSDNGGIGPGNNYPLRGHKATPWEGGTKVMGFLSGGFLPATLYGKTYDHVVHVADWYPTICKLAGVVDCTDNVKFGGVVRGIDGNDVWARLLNNGSAAADGGGGGGGTPFNHEVMPVTPDSLIYQEQWKIIINAKSTYWYIPSCGSSPPLRSCCNASCKAALSDQTTAGAWPCRGKGPSPSPPSPSPPCALAGWQCKASTYCGPGQSFYWAGPAATLADCEAKCAANATGCHCFDYRGGPDEEGEQNNDACRLHMSAADLHHSGAGYSAYYRSGKNSDSEAALVRARAGQDEAAELVLAQSPTSTPPLDREQAGCNVCTPAFPCLFDLHADIEERHNLAAAQPALVAKLAALLGTFKPYIGQPMDPAVLKAKYDCPADTRPWYGNFSGPCCRPK